MCQVDAVEGLLHACRSTLPYTSISPQVSFGFPLPSLYIQHVIYICLIPPSYTLRTPPSSSPPHQVQRLDEILHLVKTSAHSAELDNASTGTHHPAFNCLASSTRATPPLQALLPPPTKRAFVVRPATLSTQTSPPPSSLFPAAVSAWTPHGQILSPGSAAWLTFGHGHGLPAKTGGAHAAGAGEGGRGAEGGVKEPGEGGGEGEGGGGRYPSTPSTTGRGRLMVQLD